METKPPRIELTCEDALAIVSASFDGEASPSEIDALASHLVACPQCRLAAESLEADDDLLRRLGRRSAAGGDSAPEPVPSPSRRWLPPAAAAALALAVLAGLLLTTFRQQPETARIASHRQPVSDPGIVAGEDLDAELDRLTAQAGILIARLDEASRTVVRPKRNPFRTRRSENPFFDPSPRQRRSSSERAGLNFAESRF